MFLLINYNASEKNCEAAGFQRMPLQLSDAAVRVVHWVTDCAALGSDCALQIASYCEKYIKLVITK